MKKRLCAILTALCLMMSLLPATVLAAEFSDTQGHWSEAAVDRWAANGVVHGDEGNFYPDKEMTRAEMAALLANLLGLTDKGTASFADVADDAWYADAILKCAAAGIMLGDGVNANPDGKLTREEAACLVGRALGIQPVAGEASFSDGSKVSDWASGYVNAMSQKGIISGMGDNTFAPAANINRASVVSILNESISTYCNTPGEKVEATGEGITLVAAPDVTVSGKVEDLVVSAGAQGSDVTVENTTVAGTLTVTAPETTVTLKTDTSVASAVLTETAEQSKIVVEKTAEVGTLTAAAPDSTVTVSGKVENVTVADSASNTTVEAAEGSTITKVDNAAEGTTVTGSGKVENVTTSGDNTKVETGGTKVEVAEDTKGTTVGDKEVSGGETVTTEPSKPSTGGSIGGGSGSTGGSVDTPTTDPKNEYEPTFDAIINRCITFANGKISAYAQLREITPQVNENTIYVNVVSELGDDVTVQSVYDALLNSNSLTADETTEVIELLKAIDTITINDEVLKIDHTKPLKDIYQDVDGFIHRVHVDGIYGSSSLNSLNGKSIIATVVPSEHTDYSYTYTFIFA